MNNNKNNNGAKNEPEAEPKEKPEIQPAHKENGKKETVVLEKQEYEKLKEEAGKAQEHWDRLLRQQAEFDNIRKRIEREKQDFQKFAHEDIVVELLGILDDLERSVEAAEEGQENFNAFLKGIEMILAHLYELLKHKGVAPIAAKGKKFNPHEHEALLQTETSDNEDEEVIEELQKGYKIGDRVIRTAKVRVAKKIEKK
ncbi:MAG TPA: nucleotide exchange factor GrpE [Candidatus Omnitrophica bacterium]|nr:nucleotide exchange factor GrpE [Candidatus Omnitrophota bacterium]